MSDHVTPEELQKTWAENDRLEIENVFRDLLGSPAGRKFLFYLLGQTRFMQNPFTGNALTTSFNCGEMSIGQKLMMDITLVDPIGWSKMQQEANDEHRTRELAIANAAG